MTFTRNLPDALVASIEAYIELPQSKDWRLEGGVNVPYKRWATVEAYLDWAFNQVLQGPLSTPGCQPQDYLDEVAVLDQLKQDAITRYLPQPIGG